ncbi:MAG: Co2+/Mg2+ efflux protein ApaG [Alphaproteobacteria bacterium]
MYSCTTRSIKVTVVPAYLPDQSSALQDHFVWAYTIQLENVGSEVVQLINRYWHITDATGAVQEVHGAGVIGEQPVLQPGEVYQYSSGAALQTSSGIMRGHYEMHTAEGEEFTIEIPAFSLDSPEQVSRPN